MLTDVIRAAHSAVQVQDWNRAWLLSNDALNEAPDSPEVLFLMGSTMRGMGHIGLAYQLLRRALAGNQKQINLWMSYAAVLHDLNRYDDAREAFRIAHAMLPQDSMPLANIGATYVQQGKWHDAIDWCNKAIDIDADCYIARISRNFSYLSLGRWKDAWKDADWLYGRHLVVRVYNPQEHEEPQWDGTKGQTVVVQADQGVGDIIMFSQMLPQLAADCKEVILECAPRLVNLMRRTYPMITVMGTLKDSKQHWASDRIGTEKQIDAHVHISYLGNWYRNHDKDFPRASYLKADDVLVNKWRRWLEKLSRPWIGLSWQGGIQATQSGNRSVDLADLAPVMQVGGSFIDLSYKNNSAEIARWNIDHEQQVIIPPVEANDFDDTVALVAALDEIVTVTTTVAHVCGALGRTAHVLTPAVAQWRYAYRYGNGDEMIWYPQNSVRLVRQAQGEQDWTHAVKRLVRNMQEAEVTA